MKTLEKFCSDCKKNLPSTEFFKNRSTKDGYQSICKNCSKVRRQRYQKSHPEKMREYARQYYHRYAEEKRHGDRIRMNNRQKFLDSLKTPCAKCGESRPWVIQFHHVNPDAKIFGVADGTKVHKSKEDVIAECSKCVCLCANCHKEFHHLYGQKPKNPTDDLKEYIDRGDLI